uniref:Uncharacterized protein n=1 Tax=Tanacetum cinerariifolium TaxID=118510 RepID=A0A699JEG8_TANCI|nr:hypothetical protein [Tanacetum cinerariifolium]
MTTGLVQPWQTLGKISGRCLTTRVTGHDQSLARDKYHNLEDDVMVKNIFNSVKHKDGVGMKILSWMIMDEMKLTDHYWMHALVFGIDVPTTQSQPIESTQGTHRTTSTPRLPNPEMDKEESQEEELEEDDYELRRREMGKHVEESRSTRSPTIIRSLKTYSTLISLDTKELQEFTVTNPPPSSLTPSSSSPKLKLSATNQILSLSKPKPGRFKQYKNFFYELKGRYGYLFKLLKLRFMSRKNFNVLAQHLQEIMEESLSRMVAEQQQQQLYLTMRDNPQLQQDDLPILLALKYKFERLHAATTPCRPFVICPRDQDNPHDDAHPEGKNSAKRQKTFKHRTFVFGESSFG